MLLSLKTLKKHTGELTDALGEKVTQEWAAFLPIGRTLLDEAFDGAIAIYSG